VFFAQRQTNGSNSTSRAFLLLSSTIDTQRAIQLVALHCHLGLKSSQVSNMVVSPMSYSNAITRLKNSLFMFKIRSTTV